MGTILLAYRPTAEGNAALKHAVAQARLRDDELLIVRHVKLDSDIIRESETREEGSHVDLDKIDVDLSSLSDAINAEGVRCRSRVIASDEKPAKDLLEIANTQNVDLMVIGIRSRSPVGKLVLGSDAQDILLGADCPILAVKAEPGLNRM